ERPGAPVRAVEGVGKAEIEGAVPAARRVQGPGIDGIEALRSLGVAFSQLWPELTRPAADGIDGEEVEPVSAPQPQLELELALENADEHRGAQGKALPRQPARKIRKIGRARQRLAQRREPQAADTLGFDGDTVRVEESLTPPQQCGRGDGKYRKAEPQAPPCQSGEPPHRGPRRGGTHRAGTKLMLGARTAPSEPVDVGPERAPSSALARLRIFGPGTTMRCSANSSPGRSLKGSGAGFTNAGHGPAGSSRERSPPRFSATLTT